MKPCLTSACLTPCPRRYFALNRSSFGSADQAPEIHDLNTESTVVSLPASQNSTSGLYLLQQKHPISDIETEIAERYELEPASVGSPVPPTNR